MRGASGLDLYALMKSAKPVHCKTGLAMGRATNVRLVHRVNWISGAVDGGRIRYFAGWFCGDWSQDVTIVADPSIRNGLCSRCELAEHGEGFVYRCFSAASDLLYVGSTRNIEGRKHGHQLQSPWWPDVSLVRTSTYPDIEAARIAEAAAIEAEIPLINKMHNKQRVRRIGAEWLPVTGTA